MPTYSKEYYAWSPERQREHRDWMRVRKPKPVWDYADRKCLICQDAFNSSWKGNRVCSRCKDTEAWKAG